MRAYAVEPRPLHVTVACTTSSRVPATLLWITPTVLDYVGAEIGILARTLGPRLEEVLFDPVADAAVERTMTELVRRGCGWDAYTRPAAVELVASIDAFVMPMLRERWWTKTIADCTTLIEALSDWTYVACRDLEQATPDDIAEITKLAAYGTETIVHVLAAAAKLVGDENPAGKRMVRWVPVRERSEPPTVH